MKQHTHLFCQEMQQLLGQLDHEVIEGMAKELIKLRERKGRLFVLGVGGGAAHASHAVNDFRKLCNIEAYAPTDNISEITARTNDEGWETAFLAWLKISRLNANDALFIFSVGGGHEEKSISMNIVHAVKWAKEQNVPILGVVGRDGGCTKKWGTHVLVVPTLNKERITPCVESMQAIIWHSLVCDPRLQQKSTKW